MPTKALSKIGVEGLALRWEKLEKIEQRIALKRDRLKIAILVAIYNHGEIAPNAKTMRVLRGIAREIQATFPTETSVDPQRMREFLRAIPAGLGKRLVERAEKFTLRPGAWELAALTLPNCLPRARRLFRWAVLRTDGAPRVKVVKLKAARDRRARKAPGDQAAFRASKKSA